ncbi:DHH family phosphoesterase [Vaginisenegalia massiliensis]|uniref:DHH family phosphoesterase n=1 Tax=Vaginisenegalia massiliensis TaxID=2058294 RepID=UPI000F5367AA|nr:bifunctional oligoribonuclease/PAP phosphatase NrnA [Vaginisenegalia massiliensis]
MYIEQELINEFVKLIEKYETIIIHRHVRPDPDALGSQLGLKYILQNRYPDKRIMAAGTTSKGLAWIGSMDKVTREDYQNALVVICDTANQPRIDGEHFLKGSQLVKIDHHPVVDAYGDLQLVYPQASSCSEIISLLVENAGNSWKMTKEAASCLYAGIVGDSGRFLFPSTSPLTMAVAGRLMAHGIDFYQINDRFRLMTLAEAKFQAYLYDIMQLNDDGVAHVVIHQADLARFGLTEEQTNACAGLFGAIEGVLSWCLFVEQVDGNPPYRCRLRSKGPQINQIAAQHEGGGHPLASGANAYNQADIDQIVAELSENACAYRDIHISKG